MLAVVTGGSRGIGFQIVSDLLNEGYTVVAVARTCSDQLSKLQQQVGTARLMFLPCDIGDEHSREALFASTKPLGAVDLLVNCAGVAPRERKDLFALAPAEFSEVLDVNLVGTFFIAQQFAKGMAEAKKGRVVFISSVSSYAASEARAAYCVSKAGISMLTKLFAARLAREGVFVFEVSPGMIDTDMTKTVKSDYETRIQNGLTPIPRMGLASDVSRCVVGLASGKFDFCTGTVVHADGGFHIVRL